MLTVRALRDYLEGLPDQTPVVVDVHDGDSWSLRVEEVSVTTAQDVTNSGDPHEGVEVDIFWEPPFTTADPAQITPGSLDGLVTQSLWTASEPVVSPGRLTLTQGQALSMVA